MSDDKQLVLWLRGYANEIADSAAPGVADDIVDCANEIERLTAEVERLALNGIHTCHDLCPRLSCVQGRLIRKLEAEAARLREALEKIASNPGTPPMTVDTARKALRGEEG